MDINTALQMDKDRSAKAQDIQKLFFFLDPNNAPVPKADVASAGEQLQKYADQHPDLKGHGLDDVMNSLRHDVASQNSQLPSSKDKIAPWLEVAKEFGKTGNSTEKFGAAGFERDLYEHNFEAGRNDIATKIQNDLFLLGATKTVPSGDIKQATKDFEKYLKTQPGAANMTATDALNALAARAADSHNWQVPTGLDKDASAAWQKLSDSTPHQLQPQPQQPAAKPTAGTPEKAETPAKPATAAPQAPKPETRAASHEGETGPKTTRPSLNADFNKHSHVATEGDTAFQAEFKAQFEKDPAAAYQAIHDQKALLNTDSGIRHMQDMLLAVGENLGHKKVDGWNGEQTTKAIERVDAKLDGLKADAAAKAAAQTKPAETKQAETKPVAPAAAQTAPAQQPAPAERHAPAPPPLPELHFANKAEAENGFYKLEQNPGLIAQMITQGHSPYNVLAPAAHEKNGEAYLADADNRFVARYDMVGGQFVKKEVYDTNDPKELAKLQKDERNDEKHSDKNALKWSNEANTGGGYDGAIGPRGSVNVAIGRGGPVIVERGGPIIERARPFAAPIVVGERGWCSPQFAIHAGGYPPAAPRAEVGFREAPHRGGAGFGVALRF